MSAQSNWYFVNKNASAVRYATCELTCFNRQNDQRDSPIHIFRDVEQALALGLGARIPQSILTELHDVCVRSTRYHHKEVNGHAEVDEEMNVEEGGVGYNE